MRIDFAFAKTLKPHAGHESAARQLATAEIKCLMIDIQRRIGIDLHHPFLPPVAEEFAGPRVEPLCPLRIGALEECGIEGEHAARAQGPEDLVENSRLVGDEMHGIGKDDSIDLGD